MDQYQAQLDQVKFALANDPLNSELQSMAKDLEDLIGLAAAQCSSKEAISKIKNSKNKQDWNLGDKVEAKNSHGQYMLATITSMAADRSKYTVKFASSSEAAVVLSGDIRQPKKDIEQPIVSKNEEKKKKKDARNGQSGPSKSGEESGNKKRKHQSKEDYLQQKEQEQAVKQKAWQKFNDKAAKRGSAGIAKHSIFSSASSSSAASKERAMTSFNPRSKHIFQPSYEE